MNWAEHILSGERSPLGFKKLKDSSPRVREFLSNYKDLEITAQAKGHGPAGRVVPSMADTGNRLSVYISFLFMQGMLAQAADVKIGIVGSGQSFGTSLEARIASGLRQLVQEHQLPFRVSAKGDPDEGSRASFKLTDYWPYLSPPSRVGEPGEEQMFRALGRGHLIQPDVIVWRERAIPFAKVQDGKLQPFEHQARQLFACISGKATIRSDRSQSSRYEGNAMVRWRRGRPPHIVVVTAEPFPSRLGSLAWGLGDLDCVYHVNLPALYEAVVTAEKKCGKVSTSTVGSSEELKDLIQHARLKDLSQLFDDLFAEVLPEKP